MATIFTSQFDKKKIQELKAKLNEIADIKKNSYFLLDDMEKEILQEKYDHFTQEIIYLQFNRVMLNQDLTNGINLDEIGFWEKNYINSQFKERQNYVIKTLKKTFSYDKSDSPSDLYIYVKVINDCGSIHTEEGSITLNKNSTHFIKRTPIQHLINQGLLQIHKENNT